ncbi:MAG: hypothetical protein U1F43_34735 [Myxococcota bacterium]
MRCRLASCVLAVVPAVLGGVARGDESLPRPDATADAAVDTTVDAAVDTTVLPGVDAAVDTTVDAAVDATVDTMIDATLDSAPRPTRRQRTTARSRPTR